MSGLLLAASSSLTNSTENLKLIIRETNLDGFLNWFSGFCYGESNFTINFKIKNCWLSFNNTPPPSVRRVSALLATLPYGSIRAPHGYRIRTVR